jgi:hypothetical protein
MTAGTPSRRASAGADARPPYEGRSRTPVKPHHYHTSRPSVIVFFSRSTAEHWNTIFSGVSLRRSGRSSLSGVGAATLYSGPLCGHSLLRYANIAEIEVESLLRRSPEKVADVQGRLCAHCHHGWTLSTQQYRVRGATENSPELIELLTEFVRPFDNPSKLHLRHTPVSESMSTPTGEKDPKCKAAQPTGITEAPSSQSPAIPRHPAGLLSVSGPDNLDKEEEVVIASCVVIQATAARDPPYPSVYSRGSDRRYDIS